MDLPQRLHRDTVLSELSRHAAFNEIEETESEIPPHGRIVALKDRLAGTAVGPSLATKPCPQAAMGHPRQFRRLGQRVNSATEHFDHGVSPSSHRRFQFWGRPLRSEIGDCLVISLPPHYTDAMTAIGKPRRSDEGQGLTRTANGRRPGGRSVPAGVDHGQRCTHTKWQSGHRGRPMPPTDVLCPVILHFARAREQRRR